MKVAKGFRISAVLDALPGAPRGAGGGGYGWALDLLVAPAEWAVAAVAAGLCAAAKELHRAYRCREGEGVASALGCPTAEAVASAWTPAPRPLRQALVLGSRLIDLSAAHPPKMVRSEDGKRAAGRTGGLRPWFQERLPEVPYSTAMRYRRLAQRLRQALGVPAAMPLEWLLGDEPPGALTRDAGVVAAIPGLRRRVAEVLEGCRTQAALGRELERRLGIERCPFSGRRTSRGRTAAQKAYDWATDAALMERYVTRLGEGVRAKRKLSRGERRALAHLRALGITVG